MVSNKKKETALWATAAEAKQNGLRMKQLVQATGLPKSTLLYYVDQGLLPPPVKTSPNMAYYDPACVGRAAQIKGLQSRRFIPLKKIKTLLEMNEAGVDTGPVVELLGAIFDTNDGQDMSTAEFCQATGLKRKKVKELLAIGLLMPLIDGRFDQRDVTIGVILKNGAEMGMTADQMEFYPRLAEEMISHEMRLRQQVTENLSIEADAALTIRMVEQARAMRAYFTDRAFQHRVAKADNPRDEKLLS